MKSSSRLYTIGLCVLMFTLQACGGGSAHPESEPIPEPEYLDVINVYKIELSRGLLQPAFKADILEYNVDLAHSTSEINIKPSFVGPDTISIAGEATASDDSSKVYLMEGDNFVDIDVVSKDGSKSVTYSLNLHRKSLSDYTQTAYIKASNTGEDSFGEKLALDGSTLVVAATEEDSDATGVYGNQDNDNALDSGAVYVYVNENGQWVQQAFLKASNSDSGTFFGSSVAIEGDTIVVGATGEQSNAKGVNNNQSNNDAPYSGAAYVFERVGQVWQQTDYLKASNTHEASFGTSVAISGDTIVVGSRFEDSSGLGVNGQQNDLTLVNSGAVYVFVKSGAAWEQQAYIKSSNPDRDDHFGEGLAIDGDTLAVGAYKEASSATGVNGDQSLNDKSKAGAVYIFERTNTIWTQQAYIKASNTNEDYWFGLSLDLQSNTLIVGSESESSSSTGINSEPDTFGFRSGAVYVYTLEQGEWRQQAYIKASNSDLTDKFGQSVALDGNRLLVGANGEKSRSAGVNGVQDTNYINVDSWEDKWDGFVSDGAAYLFERTDGQWRQIAYLKPSNTHERMSFGDSVALNEDYLIIGAHQEKRAGVGINPNQDTFNTFENAGAVYIFQPVTNNDF